MFSDRKMQSLRSDLCEPGQRSMSWTLQVARLEADLRICVFCITIRPPCHLIKPTPCLGFEHSKMERNVTGQNLRFPSPFDYLQIHTGLTCHSPLICQHLNLFGCRVSDENLKAMLICTACGKPLPGSLCPGKARGTCTHSYAPKQSYLPACAHTQHH